jgi:hypothetical protein
MSGSPFTARPFHDIAASATLKPGRTAAQIGVARFLDAGRPWLHGRIGDF